jgi:hypothetical protein
MSETKTLHVDFSNLMDPADCIGSFSTGRPIHSIQENMYVGPGQGERAAPKTWDQPSVKNQKYLQAALAGTGATASSVRFKYNNGERALVLISDE